MEILSNFFDNIKIKVINGKITQNSCQAKNLHFLIRKNLTAILNGGNL